MEKVKINDYGISEKTILEGNLTLNIKKYLETGKYFDRVVLFTEKEDLKDNAKEFNFHFDKYSLVRKPHKDYFLYAMITLTFYIWVKLIRDDKEIIIYSVTTKKF